MGSVENVSLEIIYCLMGVNAPSVMNWWWGVVAAPPVAVFPAVMDTTSHRGVVSLAHRSSPTVYFALMPKIVSSRCHHLCKLLNVH